MSVFEEQSIRVSGNILVAANRLYVMEHKQDIKWFHRITITSSDNINI